VISMRYSRTTLGAASSQAEFPVDIDRFDEVLRQSGSRAQYFNVSHDLLSHLEKSASIG
jgi:hypothetical protein